MKHIIITISSFFILLTSNLFAQKVSLGPEIGLNIIPLESSKIGTNYQLGYNVGFQIKYQLSEKFNLTSGLYATQKKQHYTFVDTSITTDPLGGIIGGGQGGGNNEAEVYTTTTGVATELFLQLPLMVNYEYKNINLYLGPYAGILINANRKEVYDVESTATDLSSLIPGGFGGLGNLLQPSKPESASYNGTKGLALIDFGAIAGIGYRVDKLNFNLYYQYGFLDYRENKKNEKFDSHNLLQFSIAYLFNLKGSKGLKNKYDLDI